MASLPWTPYVQGALMAPIAHTSATAVLLMGRDGSMWGLAGNWEVTPQEVVELSTQIKGCASGTPVSCKMEGIKFMGMRADEQEFISNSTAKTVMCGVIMGKTVAVAYGPLDHARNINAALSKVCEALIQDPQVGSLLN